MRVLDSRRLTGPNLLLDGPGAILDLALEGADPERATLAWNLARSFLLIALGWRAWDPDAESTGSAVRKHKDGLSLAFAAHPDALYTATEINEEAWRWAADALARGALPEKREIPVEVVRRLRTALERERKPWVTRLAAEAARQGVTMLLDDKRVSVGLGVGSRVWPVEETANIAGRIPWAAMRDIPVALVTGTNGKTTTVRLLGAMAQAAGLTAGVTSTDGVSVGDDVVAIGDYSGPNGARTVLRDRRVEVGILEVARGGILRRGLGVARARAALVTNVASDHLGEYGIEDLDALADVKMVVSKAVAGTGRVVQNADDERLWARGSGVRAPVIWFTLDALDHGVAAHRRRGGEACVLEGDTLVFVRGAETETIPLAKVAEIPIAFGGAARHNVANALGAVGVAMALGWPIAAIREGLRRFESSPEANPGRANLWRLGGLTAVVDFAHNPHGLRALAAMAAAMPARRRAIVIGQAGDRDDDAIREFARTAWAIHPARVFIKEMEPFLRGRDRGVVPAMIEAELRMLGAPADSLAHSDTELDAVRAALAWGRDGDLLLLTTHAQRPEVIALVAHLAESGWTPGQPLPRRVRQSLPVR